MCRGKEPRKHWFGSLKVRRHLFYVKPGLHLALDYVQLLFELNLNGFFPK